MKSCALMLLGMAPLALSACGGKGDSLSTQTLTKYAIGGTVSGLSGSGLVLQDNAGDSLPVTANGSFTFKTSVASGGLYNVTVFTQPTSPAQTCAVTNGSGTADANVANVQVVCTTVTYTIGGTVSGLSGSGLVLQDNAGDNLPVTANGSFTFKTSVASGGSYNVTVFTQPTSPAQTCSVTNGSGTANANVANVQIVCAVTYTIGGTVFDLSGAGLVLQDNAGDNLQVGANGSFTFSTPVAIGGAYNVTILTQPIDPPQNCAVTNASGTANANVTSVQIVCVSEWTWVGGANIVDQKGIYGALGTAASGNIPGARSCSVNWTDAAGNVWLFGGYGLDSTGALGYLNDLWKYSSGEWAWMGGSDLDDQPGTYGSQGMAAPANVPGSRQCSVGWTDEAGDFWLFGGLGIGSGVTYGSHNDLWKYSAGEWAWVSGSNLLDQAGVYGTQGIPAPSNVPPARQFGVSWIDTSGSLWLFGGQFGGGLNDLWKYSAGQWTWVGGSNVENQAGTYGNQGTAAPGNIPGARYASVHWLDTAGDLWLFGGLGIDSNNSLGLFNDLWKYSVGEWTWMGGSNIEEQFGTYGTLGIPSSANVPGARSDAIGWTDAAGNFWLFGGFGFDSVGNSSPNDLWKYSGGEWTWMGGSNVATQQGIYGTRGTAASGNVPGARQDAIGWTDAAGNFWLFGGYGYDSAGSRDNLNDLWEYEP
jgi:hypothetical protein